MNLERLTEGVKRIGEFRTANSGVETHFSFLVQDDGTGSILRKRGELPAEVIAGFDNLDGLEAVVKSQLDKEAPFSLGSQVVVEVAPSPSVDENVPTVGVVGTVVKVQTYRVLLMWFGDDENPRHWWIPNTDVAAL